MERTKKEIINLIDETVQYYSEDINRRALKDRECQYFIGGETPKYCAVGRCLVDPKLVNDKLNERGDDTDIHQLNDLIADEDVFDYDSFDMAFKEKYRGYPIWLWENLQDLHDFSSYWTKNSLTEEGEEKIERIKCRVERIYK